MISIGRALMAALVCVVCVIPSWVWGEQFERGPQYAGVGVFVVLYALVAGSKWFDGQWQERPSRTAVLTGYILRICVSIILPVGMAIDLFPGLFSMNLTGLNVNKPDPTRIFATVLTQGLVLHGVIWTFIGIVYAIAVRGERRREGSKGRAFEVILPSPPATAREPR